MEATTRSFLVAIALAVFALAGRRALELRKDEKIREAWAWGSWAWAPVCAVALIIFSESGDAVLARNWVLGILGAILGACAFIWAGYMLAPPKPDAVSMPTTTPSSDIATPPLQNSGVISVGQSGGVTAGTYINQAVLPELREASRIRRNNNDGSHSTIIEIEIVAAVTPSLLHIEIQASGITNANIMPPPVNGSSAISLRNVRRRPDSYSADLPGPYGRYSITVTTVTESPIKFTYHF